MKDKIIIFITGLMLGAIISTASIYFYTLANNTNNNNNQKEMRIQERNFQNNQINGNGVPPEIPSER